YTCFACLSGYLQAGGADEGSPGSRKTDTASGSYCPQTGSIVPVDEWRVPESHDKVTNRKSPIILNEALERVDRVPDRRPTGDRQQQNREPDQANRARPEELLVCWNP